MTHPESHNATLEEENDLSLAHANIEPVPRKPDALSGSVASDSRGTETEDVNMNDSRTALRKLRPDPRKMRKKSKLVQVRLSGKSLQQIENMQAVTGVRNRTQLITAAIALADIILTETDEGGRLRIEKPDGTVEYLRMVGI